MLNHARTLLSRVPAFQRPCDLDLLVFFAKHREPSSPTISSRLLDYPSSSWHPNAKGVSR